MIDIRTMPEICSHVFSSCSLPETLQNLRSRRYPLGGSTDNQVKDLRYATDAADEVGLPARMIPLLLDLFEDTVARGHRQDDHASVQEMFLAH